MSFSLEAVSPDKRLAFTPTSFEWQRVNRRHPCPICGYKDWCEVSKDNLTVHCMRKPGAKEVSWRGGGWLHFFGWALPAKPKAVSLAKGADLVEDKAELASAEERAQAINWLIAELDTSPQHRAYLAGEDMASAPEELGYRTLSGDPAVRRELLKGLDKTFGRTLTRRLGFVRERQVRGGSRVLEFAGVIRGVDALIIPVRDTRGQSVALKARMVLADGTRTYRVMSAAISSLGCGVGTPIHVARPNNVNPELANWVVITEGEKKADYISRTLGVITLGVPGVGNWRSGGLIALLNELGPEHVVEAFDADRNLPGKTVVAREARRMGEQLAAAGYKVYSAEWPLAEGKGLDDFLRGCTNPVWPALYHFSPLAEMALPVATTITDPYLAKTYRAGRIARQFVELESETLATAFKPSLALPVTLEKARAKLAEIFSAAVSDHILYHGEGGRRILIRTTTGTGKSTAATRQIIEHLALDRPGRILYLTDTKQAYAHLIASEGVLYDELLRGRVAVREGRSARPGPYHCRRTAECQLLGSLRQPAAADICGTCPFASKANWSKYAEAASLDPTAAPPFECDKTGYLASVKAAQAARVVISPKAAILNGSMELAEFDIIIIDEDVVSFLLECQTLGTEQLAEWEEGRRRLESKAYLAERSGIATQESLPEDNEPPASFAELVRRHRPFDALFGLVKAVITDFSATKPTGRTAFIPLLKARAAANNTPLEELVERCLNTPPARRFNRYNWEKPYTDKKRVTPLRLANDLINIIAEELSLEEGADTQLWLEEHTGTSYIKAYLPRQHLLAILGGTKLTYPNEFATAPLVIFLDATAGPLFRQAIPSFEELNLEVPQPLYLIHTTTALYTGRSLAGDGSRALDKISRAIDALITRFNATSPVVFSRKAFNPDVPGDSPKLRAKTGNLRYGHFECHNKGLDDYSDCDMLVIVGHYSRPIDELRAEVQAFRRRKTAPPVSQSIWQLKPYYWQGTDGKGLGRWCRADVDELVQAVIEHDTWATVMQTIGRGRAVLRDKPLVVVRFGGMPVEGLKIVELTEVSDILEEAKITAKQKAALSAGRDEHNAARKASVTDRIEAAKAVLTEAGQQFVQLVQFARAARVSVKTLQRLGYGQNERMVRVAPIPATLPQELFILIKLKQLPTMLKTTSTTGSSP